jgi:hypothetical protein|tara:strand:+ start:3269 stop:3853 length:585 start_codon:yes stop_codon:yes gene_type:complete
MVIQQERVYDGNFIHNRFAYEKFRKEVSPYGDIVAFRAPMYVKDALIDLEDTLSNDYIHSQDAINFCWEIPGLCPLGAVSFQRLFNTAIANMLSRYIEKGIVIDGDDLMVQDEFVGKDKKVRQSGKVSVSITYSKDNVALGHTGINIIAGDKAPPFAYSSKLTDDQVVEFMLNVIDYFNAEVKDQFIATTKIIV